MKVPISWLKDYIETDMSADEIAEVLMMTGTALESIEKIGSGNQGVIVAQVNSVEKHPDADKLSLCKVQVPGQELDVVCGAPNVRPGIKVLLAPPGAELTGGFKIEKRKIRGVTSNGMICSETELGIGEDTSGIKILSDDMRIGQDMDSALGIGDTVIDFEITPNRPDCMSIIGIARELAAITGQKIKLPSMEYEQVDRPAAEIVNIDVKAPDLCPRYIGMAIDGITIGESPEWMQKRLLAAGMRPINNAVDVTNYVMLETGQPLHAFDWDKLTGGKIIVRRAEDAEKITTLDGVERELSDSNLIIADTNRGVAIAGVMGSEDSEVWARTKTILLESAYFNPQSVMATGRGMGLLTESASRFERGVDPTMTEFAAKRAISLLLKLCGGQILSGSVDVYPEKFEPWELTLRPTRVNQILGTEYSSEHIAARLRSIELEVTKNDADIKVTIPTFRRDLEREIDLIEEIARLERFDIPSTLPDNDGSVGGLSDLQKLQQRVEAVLVSLGLHEAITYSFGDPADIEKLNLDENDSRTSFIKLENPLTEDQSILRTSLLPGLLRVARYNFSRETSFVPIYEKGVVFRMLSKNEIKETKSLAVLLGGEPEKQWWGSGFVPDFYMLKNIVVNLLNTLNIQKYRFVPSEDSIFHPGVSADIEIKGHRLGSFGQLHPALPGNFDIEQNIYYLELDLNALIGKAQDKHPFSEIPKFPSTNRDLAILAPDDIEHQKIVHIITKSSGRLLEDVRLFDVYKGKNIPEGKKSMAYSMTFRAPDRTLTDEEVDRLIDKIIKTLEKEQLAIRS